MARRNKTFDAWLMSNSSRKKYAEDAFPARIFVTKECFGNEDERQLMPYTVIEDVPDGFVAIYVLERVDKATTSREFHEHKTR